MPRGSALSGLEKLLTNMAQDLKELKKEVAKLGRRGAVAGIGKRRGRKPKPKKPCTERGCKRPIYAKGLCVNHYQKARREAQAKKSK